MGNVTRSTVVGITLMVPWQFILVVVACLLTV